MDRSKSRKRKSSTADRIERPPGRIALMFAPTSSSPSEEPLDEKIKHSSSPPEPARRSTATPSRPSASNRSLPPTRPINPIERYFSRSLSATTEDPKSSPLSEASPQQSAQQHADSVRTPTPFREMEAILVDQVARVMGDTRMDDNSEAQTAPPPTESVEESYIYVPDPDLALQSVEDDSDVGIDDIDSEEAAEDAGEITSSEEDSADESDDENSRIDKVADEMFQLLTLESFGCSPEEHQEALDSHLDDEAIDNCYTLNTTYDATSSFLQGPQAKVHTVGLENQCFPKASDIGRGNFESGHFIKSLMEGRTDEDELRRNVCLHQEYRPPTLPVREYDTDGIIVFADNLCPIKSDVEVIFTKVTSMNIQTDLHVTRRVTRLGKNGKLAHGPVQVRDLPHLYLGSIPDLPGCAMYRVFPYLQTEKGSNWLTDRDAQRYFDQIWIPACRKNTSDGVRQYIPPSSQVAEQKASAKQKEHTSGKNDRTRVIRSFPLRANDLAKIELTASNIIGTPGGGLGDFRASFVVVNAKNTKLNLRNKSLSVAMARFHEQFERIFDASRVTLVSDIAVEVIPAAPGSDENTLDGTLLTSIGNQRSIYLWKACCLQKMVDSLRTKLFGDKRGRVEVYNNVFLRDATSVTVVPPQRSTAKRAGCDYFQAYIVEKAFEDANSIRPFDRTEIVNLAVAEALYRQSSFSQSRGTLERNFLACKKRLKTTLEAYRGSSTGVRLEGRLGYKLRKAVWERATKHDNPMSTDLEFLWVLPMTEWLDFKKGNFQKLTALIDVVILASPKTGVTNGTAQLLFALLTYLQNLSNCNPRRKSILWREQRLVENETRFGMGLEVTITETGFGWLSAMADWDRFCVQPHVVNNLFGVGDVVGVCYKDQDALRYVYDARTQLQVCYDVLRKAEPVSRMEYLALEAIANFVLRTYRRDVWDILCPAHKSEVREEFRTQTAIDNTAFCWDSLTEAFVKPPILVKGNRSGRNFGPEEVFRWVMTRTPGRKRDYMDGKGDSHARKPFRSNLYEVWQITDEQPGLTQRWESALREVCKTYLWLFPMPDGNGALTCCEDKRHKFVSVIVDGRGNWLWGRERKRSGKPPPWPATLTMSPEELDKYFKLHGKAKPASS